MGSTRTGGFHLAVAAAVASLVFVVPGLETPPPDHLRDYPELWRADPEVVYRIGQCLHSAWWSGEVEGTELGAVLEAAVADAPLALLRVVVDRRVLEPYPRYAYPGLYFPMHFRTLPFTPFAPATERPLMGWIASCRDASLNPLLLRMLTDRDLDLALRERALIAVTWPGNRAAVKPLVAFALDPEEEPVLRCHTVLRLSKLECPLPEPLHALLYRPFHGLDYLTACALAETGDLEAPSLLFEALGMMHGLPRFLEPEGEDFFDVEEDSAYVERVVRRVIGAPQHRKGTDLIDDFREWLAANPGSTRTRFERRLREALPGESRAMEFARGALEASGVPERVWPACFSRLRRLALGLQTEIADMRDPEGVIEILNRRLLLREHERWERLTSVDNQNCLEGALLGSHTVCLGLTTLYVAVATALDLPVHGVASPRHCFARWDDGEFRRNIETTEGGAEYPDSRYMEIAPWLRVAPETVEAGVYLRSLSDRELLAEAWGDRSYDLLQEGLPAKAEEAALRALQVAPTNVLAMQVRAEAILRSGIDRDEQAFEVLREALALHPAGYDLHATAAKYYSDTGRHEDALGHIEACLSQCPEDASSLHAKARCLLELGRFEEARPLVLRCRIDRGLRCFPDTLYLDLRARIYFGDPSWRDLLRGWGGNSQNLVLEAADAYLTGVPGHPPEPEKAGELLDEISALGEPDAHGDWGNPVRSAEYSRLRARLHLEDGNPEAAGEALRQAIERGGRGRETLRLERAIRAAEAETGG